MLVLNTNQGSGGAYELSNKSIVPMYPECDGHILIYPELAEYNGSSLGTAFEVNGTPVHALSGVYEMPYDNRLNMPNNITGNSPGTTIPGCARISVNNVELLFRVGIETPLQAGLTIGKQIIFPVLYAFGGSNSPTSLSLQVKVGLLHTDGTIDYIATNNYGYATSHSAQLYMSMGSWGNTYSVYSSAGQRGKSNKVITGSGMTTVEGDRIIVEYITNAVSTNLYVVIGTPIATKIEERIYPIQISID